MKCESIRPIFVSTSKMIEILCSDADFKVLQCAVKSPRLLQCVHMHLIHHQVINEKATLTSTEKATMTL
jgi:hypothetical protein